MRLGNHISRRNYLAMLLAVPSGVSSWGEEPAGDSSRPHCSRATLLPLCTDAPGAGLPGVGGHDRGGVLHGQQVLHGCLVGPHVQGGGGLPLRAQGRWLLLQDTVHAYHLLATCTIH